MQNYQRCTRCVMDNASDKTIRFDAEGRCNYCTDALISLANFYHPDEVGKRRLKEMTVKLKKEGVGKKYDCIVGLSGGLDSSYLTYLAYKLGLRALIVHIDDGYDTEIAQSNIRKLIEKTGFDYEVVCPDQKQFDALTLAFMRAGVPNIAIPQDNILFAFLCDLVRKYKIKCLLSGLNASLESVLQRGNTHNNLDLIHIMDIQKKFGTEKTDRLKFISTKEKMLHSRLIGVKTYTPLNNIDYNRNRAFRKLYDFCGFEYYGSKHLENKFTAFTQLVWFPQKFGVDKRTSHLSSMIVSGQITREEALMELEKPLYDAEVMSGYIHEIEGRLGVSDEELQRMLTSPGHQHNEYRTEDNTPFMLALRLIRDLRARKRRIDARQKGSI